MKTSAFLAFLSSFLLTCTILLASEADLKNSTDQAISAERSGDYEKAIKLYRQVLEDGTKYLSRDDPRLAAIRDMLTAAYEKQSKSGSGEAIALGDALTGEPDPVASDEPIRIIHFPKDKPLGRIRIGRPAGADFNEYIDWQDYGTAQGDRTVPADAMVRLEIPEECVANLPGISCVGVDDIYAVRYRTEDPLDDSNETVLPHLTHLTGLEDLSLHMDLSAEGIQRLKSLPSLRILYLGATGYGEIIPGPPAPGAHGASLGVSDDDLSDIAQLPALEELHISSRRVTGKGLANLARSRTLRRLTSLCTSIKGPEFADLASLPHLEFFQANHCPNGDQMVAGLSKCASLQELTLIGCGVTDKSLGYLPALNNLKSLSLRKNSGVTSAGMIHIGKLRALEDLNLSETGVGDSGLAYFKSLNSLKSLQLNDGITAEGIRHLKGINSLQYLAASYKCGDEALKHIGEMPNLRFLTVGCSLRSEITDAGYSHLAKLKNLEELHIGCNIVTEEGLRNLLGLDRLKDLSITGDGISNEHMAVLSELTQLEHLNISPNASKELTVSGVNLLNKLKNLKELHVSKAQPDDAALDLSGLKNLESLNLNIGESVKNTGPGRKGSTFVGGLTDQDLACFADLKNVRRLFLGYSNEDLSDAGLAQLSQMPKLSRLSIGGPNLTDSSLGHLSALRNLTSLGVEGDFTDEGLWHLENLGSLTYLKIDTHSMLSLAALDRLRSKLPAMWKIDTPGSRASSQ